MAKCNIEAAIFRKSTNVTNQHYNEFLQMLWPTNDVKKRLPVILAIMKYAPPPFF